MANSEILVAEGEVVIDLVFSIDDEMSTGKGWYLQRYDYRDGETSSHVSVQSWRERAYAKNALRSNRVRWQK